MVYTQQLFDISVHVCETNDVMRKRIRITRNHRDMMCWYIYIPVHMFKRLATIHSVVHYERDGTYWYMY